MVECRRASHALFRLGYHLVFITKYRKAVLNGNIAKEIRKLTREICRTHDIEIVKGLIGPGHIHILLDVPPKIYASKVMRAISTNFQDQRRLPKEFWGRHLWARGYFVATEGTVTEEAVTQYIENQDAEIEGDGFEVPQ